MGKIQVVYDATGKVSAFAVGAPPNCSGTGPVSGPAAQDGQHVAEFDLPASLSLARREDLAKIAGKLKVDVSGSDHTLKLDA